LGIVATIETTHTGKAKLTRTKAAISAGKVVSPSNESDLCNCALYLEKERSAVSAECHHYPVAKV
ncbi:hypothetical protein, partial [Streptococcus pneumoniae]|uniref:hypothetical protein n=1 Tax=Streptococcus pneumoniae TaxID=1313 RepID=UPI001E3A562C